MIANSTLKYKLDIMKAADKGAVVGIVKHGEIVPCTSPTWNWEINHYKLFPFFQVGDVIISTIGLKRKITEIDDKRYLFGDDNDWIFLSKQNEWKKDKNE